VPWKDREKKLKQKAQYRAWKREADKAKALGLPEPPKAYLKQVPRDEAKHLEKCSETAPESVTVTPKKPKPEKPKDKAQAYDDLSPDDLQAIDLLRAENAELKRRYSRLRRFVSSLEQWIGLLPGQVLTVPEFRLYRDRFTCAEALRFSSTTPSSRLQARLEVVKDLYGTGEVGIGGEGCSDCTDEGDLEGN